HPNEIPARRWTPPIRPPFRVLQKHVQPQMPTPTRILRLESHADACIWRATHPESPQGLRTTVPAVPRFLVRKSLLQKMESWASCLGDRDLSSEVRDHTLRRHRGSAAQFAGFRRLPERVSLSRALPVRLALPFGPVAQQQPARAAEPASE